MQQPAWDAPLTGHCYAAYRLGALRWFLAGLGFMAAAFGLSAYAVLVLRRPGLGVFIVTGVLLGVIGLVTGAGGLLRARRFRQVLQQAPWRAAVLRVAGANLRLDFAASTAAAADDRLPAAVDVRLMTTSRWRVRAVVGNHDAEVVVCPAQDGGFVLASQGLGNLYGLLPLRRRVARQRP